MNNKIFEKIIFDLGLKSRHTPYKWVRGKNGVPAPTAAKLEALTGIDRRKFCWPNDFGDPWPDVEMIYKNKIIPNKNNNNGKQK